MTDFSFLGEPPLQRWTNCNGCSLQRDYKSQACKSQCYAKRIRLKKRFVSSSFIRPLHLLNEILKRKMRSLFWIVWNADVLCWTATEDSTLYHPENTHALKATERVGDSADTCGSHSTGCLNQNASFTPAICEFTTDIHYRRSKMICASRKNLRNELFAVAPGQRSTGSGSPRLNQTKHQPWGRSRKHRSQSADKTVSTDGPIAFPMKYYDMLEIAGANSHKWTPTAPDVNGNSASLSVFRVHFLEVVYKLANPSENFLGVLIQRLSEF